ncbi:UspA domain protein [Citrifermentans bremense]|uniref:UspA domain protein n=1 Tax=Citrifermentans bremense TaxID=60035 RepID=A0A6S6LZG7_9BACT|nr:universal stress protein [Citrifermentans bremense]BCG47472.1 UspA domain protein [Citrifermentans bremense]
MFWKILVATDLTPASDELIECVESFRELGTEEVVLAHVTELVDATGAVEVLPVQPVDVDLVLRRQKDTLERLGLKVVVQTLLGTPALMLEQAARDHGVNVILAGSHGKGLIRSAALGSVSRELLRTTSHPLLLDRLDLGKEGEASCRRIFSRVLFPTDYSETAEKALDFLGKIALETGCSVTLMHVMESQGEDQENERRREEECWYLLEAKKRRLERLGAAEVSIDLVHGRAAEEILSRMSKGAFTSIVMGGKGKGVLTELILGSTANEVARHATLPVLFVPAAVAETPGS